MTQHENLNQLILILQIVRDKIGPDCDVAWTRYNSPKEVLERIDGHIQAIQKNDLSVLEQINHDFGPTCTFQEVSISNGWGQEFIDISGKFDKVYQDLK